MSRYIDADKLKNHYAWWKTGTAEMTLSEAKNVFDVIIDEQPTADAAEIKRGRWLTTDAYPHKIYCSNCYGTYALDHWGIWIDESLPRNYCPNCGASMQGEEE